MVNRCDERKTRFHNRQCAPFSVLPARLTQAQFFVRNSGNLIPLAVDYGKKAALRRLHMFIFSHLIRTSKLTTIIASTLQLVLNFDGAQQIHSRRRLRFVAICRCNKLQFDYFQVKSLMLKLPIVNVKTL